MSRAARRQMLAVLGVVALLASGVVIYLTGRGQDSFGWFAYAPLSNQASRSPFSGLVIWSRREEIGAALVSAGLLLGAGVAGFWLGRR